MFRGFFRVVDFCTVVKGKGLMDVGGMGRWKRWFLVLEKGISWRRKGYWRWRWSGGGIRRWNRCLPCVDDEGLTPNGISPAAAQSRQRKVSLLCMELVSSSPLNPILQSVLYPWFTL